YVNPAFEALWQLPQSALVDNPLAFTQRIHPDDRDRVMTTVQTCMRQGEDFDLEYRLRRPDNTIRWLRDRGFMIRDEAGNPTKIAGIATDITESKRAEIDLQQYERVIAAIPDALCLIGKDYRYRLSNAAYQNWFHQGGDVCGLHLADCFGEDFFTTVSKPRCDQALAGNTQRFEEWLYNPHQKTARFISITYAPYYEANGEVGGIIHCIRDLTTLKQTRDRLDQMANRLQLHINNSPLVVIEWTPAQQVENWSSQATAFFGWSESEMRGLHVTELPIFRHDGKSHLANDIRDRLHCSDQQQTVITQNVDRDGSELFCEWYNSVLRNAAGEVVSILSFVQNITERRQAQLALQASEERWQLAITGSNEGIWDWQISTDEIFCSPRWKEQLGYADDELDSSHEAWISRVHPDDLERIQTAMQAHLQGQSPTYQSEYRLRHRSGDYVWILSRGQAIFNEAGQPIRFVGSHADITDRKQVELDLQASQQLLQMVFDHLPQRVFWKSLNGRFLGCNQVFAKDMGYKHPNDIIGQTDAELKILSPESLQLFRDRDRAVIETDQTITFEEQAQRYADGKTRWVSTTKSPFKTPQGQLIGIFGCYEDVTERVQAQRSIQRYARMVEAAKDGICLLDTDYRYQVINDTYRIWYGDQDHPILGQTVAEVLGQVAFEQRLQSSLDKCLQGTTVHYDRWFDFPRLGRRFHSATLTPYREENGDITGVVVSIRDLTDLKESEDQQRQLLEIIEATPDFVSMARPSGEVIYLNPALTQFVVDNLPNPTTATQIQNYHPQWATALMMHEAIPTAIAQGTWQGETALISAGDQEIPIVQTITAHRDERGNVQLISMIARDYRPQKALEQELRHRLAFEQLLSRLSTDFVNLPTDGLLRGITHALRIIAEATGAQRGYVYLMSADAQQGNLYSQWQEPNLAPIAADWHHVSLSPFKWWTTQLSECQVIAVDDVKHLPPEAEHERFAMAAFDTRSLVLVPMRHSQQLIGYVGFSATLAKAWTEYEIALLQIVGDLFANAYQRQQAEVALRQQEHYYRSLIENASDLVMLLDHRGRVQYATPSITRLLNYQPSEVQNRSAMRLTVSADRPLLAARWKAILQHPGTPQPVFQCRVQHKTAAQWRYFEVIATSLLDDPVIQGVVVNCRDVSDRVAAEAAQRHSEQVFQAIFEQSAVGMAQLALNGTYIKVNPAFCQLVGYPDDELIGKHFAKITHPDDLAYDRRMSAAVARGDVPSQTIHIRFVCADTSVRHVQVVMTAVQGDQGKPAFWASVYNDMTEQVLAERSLRSIVEGTASVTGEAFFPVLAQQLADILNVDHILINQLGGDTLNSIIYWSQQQQQAPLTYRLSDTPCERTLQEGFYYCPQAVQAEFPKYAGLATFNAESYIGVALKDSQGQLLGGICVLHSQTIQNLDNAITLLRIFAARASAELERQEVSRALTNSEANWRKILENMPVLLNAVDSSGLVKLWNKECERVTGYRADEIVDHPEALSYLYPDSAYRQTMFQRWQQAGHNYRNWEWEVTCKDGSQRTIAWSNISDLFPIADLGAWGVGVDVTERRRAENALRQSEERFQRLAANMPGVIYRYHQYPDGRDEFSYLSPGSVALWEYEPEVICADANRVWNLIHPDDVAAFQQSIADAITQETTWLHEHRIITPSGRVKWIQAVAKGARQSDGGYAWDGILIDVTALRQAEADLSDSEARFQRLALNTPGIIYRYHLNVAGHDHFSYLSAACQELLEIAPEVGMEKAAAIWSLIHPHEQERLRTALLTSAQTLTPLVEDYRVTTQSGQQKWFRMVARPEQEPSGDYFWDGLIVDVTEQIATQTALQQSEILNRAILEALPDLMIRMRRDGLCLDVQYPSHFPVLCSKDQHVGHLAQETLAAPIAAQRMQMVEQALSTGNMQICEYELPIDGGGRWEEARVVPMTQDEVLVLVRDISDRKRTEAALKHSEALNRAIIDALPDMLIRMTRDGVHLSVHHPPSFLPLVPNQESLGLNARDILPPDLAEHLVGQAVEAIATQQTQICEYTLAVNGQLRWEESRIVPLTQDEVLVLIRDIDERRRAEEEVRRLNQVLEDHNQRLEELIGLRTAELVTFMNSLPDQIFVIDRAQNVTFGNRVAAEFAQLSCRQEFEGKNNYTLFSQDQANIYEQQNQQVFQTGEILHVEEAFQTAAGQVFFDTYKIPLKRPDGEVYALIGTSRDITELVETRQALEQQATQLAATNQELQSFSYSVSHDLRAPLRHINGFITALKQRLESTLPDSDAKVTHYIDVIDNSSQKMAALIDGLLTLSRIGRREMSWRPVPLKPLVDQAIEVVTAVPQAPLEQLQITVDDLPTVYGDATLLQQVLSNLIGNAVKFSRDRTPAIIHIGQQPDGTCFVRDNGVGFDMTYADKLFSPFQRLHKQDEFQGTGIGLAIVNRIIHRHHGSIWAESESNQGTTVYFSLPLEPITSSTTDDSPE
ncbi:MAG: PAS domain S-box protein, partial [Cyanobacteria bacterium P01_D01_bin.6]